MTRPNKLEVTLGNPFQLGINLRARPQQTQSENLSDASILGKFLVLPANVRLAWKLIARDKHSGLLRESVNYGQKMFYNIDTWRVWTRVTDSDAESESSPSFNLDGEEKIGCFADWTRSFQILRVLSVDDVKQRSRLNLIRVTGREWASSTEPSFWKNVISNLSETFCHISETRILVRHVSNTQISDTYLSKMYISDTHLSEMVISHTHFSNMYLFYTYLNNSETYLIF